MMNKLQEKLLIDKIKELIIVDQETDVIITKTKYKEMFYITIVDYFVTRFTVHNWLLSSVGSINQTVPIFVIDEVKRILAAVKEYPGGNV